MHLARAAFGSKAGFFDFSKWNADPIKRFILKISVGDWFVYVDDHLCGLVLHRNAVAGGRACVQNH